jgi:ETFB lysine methyltransferase
MGCLRNVQVRSAFHNPNSGAAAGPISIRQARVKRRLRHLRRALEASYATTLQPVTFDGLSIDILRVADVDTLLDRLPPVQFRPDERLPYWADLWPSALALARYLWRAVEVGGLPVLELGCGLGLVGVVASCKGAVVTMTDYEADALAFARYNLMHNGCQQAHVRYMDWHHSTLTEQYSLIVASDIIYERVNFLPIVHLLQSCLAPSGRFILAEPNRPVARDFIRLIRDHGFRYARVTESLVCDGERFDVSIYDGYRTTIRP